MLSVDVLRGATIAAMVMVNDPAVGPPYLYRQLTHAPWNGCTFADTIFPGFLFLLGVSATLSPRRRSMRRAVRRAAILFAVGLVINTAPLALAGNGATSILGQVRIMGVLQRIALADLLASVLLARLDPRAQVAAAVGLLLGYWAMLAHVAVPGHPVAMLTPAVNLPGFVDRSILGAAHMYPAGHGGYDPEGLLGCLPAAAGILIGAAIGRLLRNQTVSRPFRVAALAAAGTAMTAGGLAWSYILPINKRMWTPSYVLLISGFATLALAACHLIVDRDGRTSRAVAWPLKILGANALVVYAGTDLTAVVFGAAQHPVPGIPHAPFTYWVWWRWLAPSLGPWRGNAAWAVGVLLAWWLVAFAPWRRRLLLRA